MPTDLVAQDAERYRWLRAHWFRVELMTNRDSHALTLTLTEGWPGSVADNARLDSAIDDELQAEAKTRRRHGSDRKVKRHA